VADVADALILRRLFAALWEAGVVVVATSNRQPERLYERGLNREYFAPFIPMLQGQCAVHPMESDTDHRQLCSPHADGAQSFFVADSDSREDFETAVATLRGADGWGRRMVEVRQGRQLAVERAAGGVCRFEFGELCEADVGAADFGVRTHARQLASCPTFRQSGLSCGWVVAAGAGAGV